MQNQNNIPGYDYGSSELLPSPVSLDELRELEGSVGWTDEDASILLRAGKVLQNQAESMVDAWRARIGAQPHLARMFFDPQGKPDESYKARVKQRFVQWVLDAFFRPHDQAWLDYQNEIGLRHTPAKKNLTDRAQTAPVVPLRHLIAFTAVIVTTVRSFAQKAEFSTAEIDRFQEAWTKSVMLQVTLWTRPYVSPTLW